MGRTRIYRTLYFQILLGIAVGIALGIAFPPDLAVVRQIAARAIVMSGSVPIHSW
jgi:Na+/H+-dicarboxylate symporter